MSTPTGKPTPAERGRTLVARYRRAVERRREFFRRRDHAETAARITLSKSKTENIEVVMTDRDDRYWRRETAAGKRLMRFIIKHAGVRLPHIRPSERDADELNLSHPIALRIDRTVVVLSWHEAGEGTCDLNVRLVDLDRVKALGGSAETTDERFDRSGVIELTAREYARHGELPVAWEITEGSSTLYHSHRDLTLDQVIAEETGPEAHSYAFGPCDRAVWQGEKLMAVIRLDDEGNPTVIRLDD